jgi:hypothetical protein
MGKYEAVRVPLAKRLILSFDERLAQRGISRPNLPRVTRAGSFPALGFFFVIAFTMVYTFDPYAGNLASASTMQVFDPNKQTSEAFGFNDEYSVTFERGGFRMISGKEATSYFVLAAPTPEAGTAKAYAYNYIQNYEWGLDQYSCLVNLWTRESQWRTLARNPSSGAYGIPQAWPASKMATEGADWMTNPETQVRWGVKYIATRYKTACGAWAHSEVHNWY